MKRITILLFFAMATAASVFALVSCDEESAKEVPVGVVVPLTGVLESTGLNMKNGMELALEEINESSLLEGKKIRFIIEDSESTVEGAQRAYRKLIEQDGVVAVLGPFTSTSTREVIPIAHENKVISFSPTSAANGLSAKSEFAFRASLTVERLVPKGVSTTRERLRYSRVATITNSLDAFSQSNFEQLERAFDDEGVTVVSEQSYARPQNEPFPDLTDQLTEIKDANPDAIFISALTSGRTEIPVQARRLGIEVPFIMTLLTIDDVNKANDQLPGVAEGAITFTVWLAAVDTPENRAFLRNYQEKYDDREPNAFAARSYGAVHILAQAIADADSNDSQSIRDSMADLRVENTVFGDFYFDRNGDAVYEPIVGIVRDGVFEVFGQ